MTTKNNGDARPKPQTRKLAVLASCILGLSPTLALGANGTWNTDASPASWATPSNWTGNAVPGDAGSTVTIIREGAPFTRLVNLDGNQTVGILNIGGSAHYTLAPGTGGTLFFDNLGNNAQLNLDKNYNRTISAPVVLNSSLDIYSSASTVRARTISGTITAEGDNTAKTITIGSDIAGSPIELNGTISDGAGNRVISIHQNANGSLTLGGANTFSGGVFVNAGTLILPTGNAPNSRSALGTGTLTLNGGGLMLSGFTEFDYGNATKILTNTDINMLSSASSAKAQTLGDLEVGNHTVTVHNSNSIQPTAAKDKLVFRTTTLTGNATFDVNTLGSVPMLLTLGSLNGSHNLTKTGTGEMELNSAAGNYSGTTSANGGLLKIGNNTALGTGNVVIGGTNKTTLKIDSTYTISNNITYGNTHTNSSLERISAGSSTFNVGTTGKFNSDLGGIDTTAAIRAADASGITTLSMSFSNISPANNDWRRISDVFNLTLDNVTNKTFVLQLNTLSSNPDGYLAWLNNNAWTLATDGNTGTGNLAGSYTSTWDAFLLAHGGTFNAVTMLGAYGYDTGTGQGWAVLNHASDYALVIPEPSTVILCGLGLSFMLFRLRTSHRRLG